jgi:hypothetical protein
MTVSRGTVVVTQREISPPSFLPLIPELSGVRESHIVYSGTMMAVSRGTIVMSQRKGSPQPGAFLNHDQNFHPWINFVSSTSRDSHIVAFKHVLHCMRPRYRRRVVQQWYTKKHDLTRPSTFALPSSSHVNTISWQDMYLVVIHCNRHTVIDPKKYTDFDVKKFIILCHDAWKPE